MINIFFKIVIILIMNVTGTITYPFFNAVIIDKWSGNLKEYPSLKGKYSIFLSYPYDKF